MRPGAIGAGALYPERAGLSQAAGPQFKLLVSIGSCQHVKLAKSDTSSVYGYRHMLVSVSVYPDDHLSCAMTLVICDSDHLCLLNDGVSAGRADTTAKRLVARLL